MQRRSKNQKKIISGESTYCLIQKLERFVNEKPLDENEQIGFEDLEKNLKIYAEESSIISEKTALHKILYDLAYDDFYICLYDDLDCFCDISDFAEYAREMFNEMNIPTPRGFGSSNEKTVMNVRDKSRDLFIHGLWHFVDSAFAHLWHRKFFLHQFNYKMSNYLTQKIERVSLPKWLVDALIKRERGLCHYCEKPVVSPSLDNQVYDIEHVIPLDLFGTNDPTNLVLACQACNSAKGVKLISVPDTFSWPKYN